MIGTNLRGEMKSISTEASADSVEFALIGKLAEALRLSSSEVSVFYDNSKEIVRSKMQVNLRMCDRVNIV
jgi:hypothetical protein